MKRYIYFLFPLFLFALIFNLSQGSVNIPFSEIIDYFFGTVENIVWYNIIHDIRIPKLITSAIAGASLALGGLQMQALFRNALAGPFILGISSGGSLGVALSIFLGIFIGDFFSVVFSRSWMFVISSVLGSFFVLLVVLLASYRVKHSISLLIIGLMFGSAVGALVSILQFFSEAKNLQAYVMWTFGSLGNVSWEELSVLFPIAFIGIFISFFLSKQLNVLCLGDDYAKSMGLNIKISRTLLILVTSILSGTVTAFCGPIAFVGMAVPHMARIIFNTSNHLLLTPIVIFLGSSLMLIFDSISQLPGLPHTLPINAVTTLLGTPFVIWLVLKKSNIHYKV